MLEMTNAIVDGLARVDAKQRWRARALGVGAQSRHTVVKFAQLFHGTCTYTNEFLPLGS